MTAIPIRSDPLAVPRWRLRLLGALELRGVDGQLARWPSRTAARLLARLALAPARVHPREELVELLWPGAEADVGRNRLRQVLSTLKSLLEAGGGQVIDADRHGLRLHPGSLWCDAVVFEQLARNGRGDQAQALYGGELMPGVFDEWVLDARAPLAALAERIESTPAPLRARTADPLPASWTRVFGIEAPRQRLAGLVQASRLVTVLGPGGCGKTRLALETARQLQGLPARFDRVAFVSLVDCRDEAHALAVLGRELQLGSGDTLRQAAERLVGQRVLLVLDNFEQLVASAAALPLALLERLPELHLLVTSRLRAGWPGEQVLALGGLPLPPAGADAAGLAENPAMALFLDRARAVDPGFAAAPTALPAVAELVRRLDGMPLALELAASRVASFKPEQMLRLLDAGAAGGAPLELLSRPAPRGGQDRRHASIREVVDWSWQLLDAEAQALMHALAAAGGTAGGAALAHMLGDTEARVQLRLDALVSHSMARACGGDPPRWALLEPVRDCVLSTCSADEGLRLQRALHGWLLQWALALPRSAPQALLDAELPLVHGALASASTEPRTRLELALALRTHWDSRGMPLSLQQPLEAALAEHEHSLAAAADPLASQAHELLALLRFEAGFTAVAQQHVAAALQRAGQDASTRAHALARQVWLELAMGQCRRTPAESSAALLALLQEAQHLALAAHDRDAQARVLLQQAVVLNYLRQDWAGSDRLLEQSQALWLELGDRRKAYARLRNRGQCWDRMGRVDDAQKCFETCARVARDEGDVVELIDSLVSLCSLHAARRRWAESLATGREAVQVCWQHWHRHGLSYALWNPPLALARLRRPADAVRLMAFAAHFWQTGVGPLSEADTRELRRVRRLCRAQLGPAAEAALWTDGATLTIAQAVDLVLQTGGPANGT